MKRIDSYPYFTGTKQDLLDNGFSLMENTDSKDYEVYVRNLGKTGYWSQVGIQLSDKPNVKWKRRVLWTSKHQIKNIEEQIKDLIEKGLVVTND